MKASQRDVCPDNKQTEQVRSTGNAPDIIVVWVLGFGFEVAVHDERYSWYSNRRL
jgi:hypothetical protein